MNHCLLPFSACEFLVFEICACDVNVYFAQSSAKILELLATRFRIADLVARVSSIRNLMANLVALVVFLIFFWRVYYANACDGSDCASLSDESVYDVFFFVTSEMNFLAYAEDQDQGLGRRDRSRTQEVHLC